MMVWISSMMSPVCLTAMEIFLLHFLVYGLRGRVQGKGENVSLGAAKRISGQTGAGRMMILLVLFVLGVYLRTHRIRMENNSIASYMNMFTMAVYYDLILVFYLNINSRLSFFYLVIYDIPIDVCDLIVFVAMLRMFGIDVSGGNAGILPTLVYLIATFLLRFSVLAMVHYFLGHDRHRTPGNMQLFLIAISVLPFLYMRDLGFWLPLASEDIGNSTILFLAVTGVITLILVIGNERIVYYHIQNNELLKMQHLVEHQQEQYRMRKEAVDLVNQKYHDMRHQLVGILGMNDVEEIHSYVNSLRQEIQPFETVFRTGHSVMDILLMDKAEECERKGIQLIPTVEGQVLSMLETSDLCTIFGNALDNAIESCEKLPEGKTRRIALKVCKVKGFLAIHVENSCIQKPKTENGRILTSKEDAQNHGFGLRGIYQAIEKYQGEMETEATEEQFILTILIPLPS